MCSRINKHAEFGGSCSDSVNKNEKEKVGRTCQACRRGSKYETEQGRERKEEQKRQKAHVRKSLGKKSPQTFAFVNNCIVFKVQEFMYKNTVVLASAPQRKKEKKKKKEQKKGTNSGGGEWEKQSKYKTERNFT